jgi:hypothetical protein
MKKAILALFIIISLCAFYFKMIKPVSGIELNITNSKGEIITTGKTDKKGNFLIKIKEKGNYALNISSDEIIRGLTRINNGKKEEVHFLVTLTVNAESNSWTTDTENHVTHTQTIEKDSYIEVTQTITLGNPNRVSEWSESLINIVSKGDGEIQGSINCQRIK